MFKLRVWFLPESRFLEDGDSPGCCGWQAMLQLTERLPSALGEASSLYLSQPWSVAVQTSIIPSLSLLFLSIFLSFTDVKCLFPSCLWRHSPLCLWSRGWRIRSLRPAWVIDESQNSLGENKKKGEQEIRRKRRGRGRGWGRGGVRKGGG